MAGETDRVRDQAAILQTQLDRETETGITDTTHHHRAAEGTGPTGLMATEMTALMLSLGCQA